MDAMLHWGEICQPCQQTKVAARKSSCMDLAVECMFCTLAPIHRQLCLIACDG